jgi:hypothetical protein
MVCMTRRWRKMDSNHRFRASQAAGCTHTTEVEFATGSLLAQYRSSPISLLERAGFELWGPDDTLWAVAAMLNASSQP